MPDVGLDPVRILLIEDSDIDVELLTGHLAKAGMPVDIRRVFRRAAFLEALEGGGIDVILADYSLPDFDGLSALSLARERAPDLPFIFVSGIVGEEFATNAMKRGATDYVVKRNLSRLPTAIERALSEAHERTERQRAEQALRQLNATLEAQVEQRTRERDRIWKLGPDLFTVVGGDDGRVLSVNPAWASLMGAAAGPVLGQRLADLVHPDDRTPILAALALLAAGGPAKRFEGRLKGADGTWRWIAWTAAAEGETIYAIGRDVTATKAVAVALETANQGLTEQIAERQRIEATLSQMQRLEAVGQLTSGVAHDFNNLLTVILGNIDFVQRHLEREGGDGKIRQRIANMRTAAQRGATLTAQLLAFSRRQRLEPKSVDLNATVGGMRDLLQGALGGSVRLETVLKPRLWPALVDPTQIEMIILNLAINARDAMEVGGGLTVETANVTLGAPGRPEEPPAGEYVCLSVSDTGSGMTPEVLAKAFEPFFTTKGAGKGSGLGLAQVFGFAKQSGGGVRIDTRLGEGTSVKVYLPRAESLDVEQPAAEPHEPAPVPQGRTVLVVDDDSAVREITTALLSEMGYRVLEAGSGGAALDLLRREPIDILLADYAMPGMNGMETAREAWRIRPGLPLLIITGYADFAALKEVGEDRIVSKPFRDGELAEKIEAALGVEPAGAKVIPLPRRS